MQTVIFLSEYIKMIQVVSKISLLIIENYDQFQITLFNMNEKEEIGQKV